jgi:hypothetical protein
MTIVSKEKEQKTSNQRKIPNNLTMHKLNSK